MAQEFTDVACPLCGTVCDDLAVTVEGGEVAQVRGGCERAAPWMKSLATATRPVAEIEGVPAELQAAVARAAEILASARYPLIYGLTRSATPGQRAAVALADRLGAVIDTVNAHRHAGLTTAFAEVGESTATLGEVAARSDLVVFWRSDPAKTHPRLFPRVVEKAGEFTPGGRQDRRVVVIDAAPTATSKLADELITLPAERDFEAIAALRLLVAGQSVPEEWAEQLPLAQLTALAEQMKGCRYGSLYFAAGLGQGGAEGRTAESILRLVTELCNHTRFVVRRLKVSGDLNGGESVLSWQSGYPASVSFANGYPTSMAGELSAAAVLARGEADACLLVGSEGVEELSPAAQEHLASIPVIALDYANVDSQGSPVVRITTGAYGVHYAGTAYRLDDVPIPLRKILPTEYPSDEAVLQGILEEVGPLEFKL